MKKSLILTGSERQVRMRKEEIKKGIIIVGIIVGLYVSIRFFLPVMVPFLIAWLIAGGLRPVVEHLMKWSHCSEKLASVIVFLLMLIVLVLGGRWGLGVLYGQIRSFVLCIPFYREQFMVGLGDCCRYIDQGLQLGEGVSLAYATKALIGIFSDFQTTVLPGLTTGTIAVLRRMLSSVLFLFIMIYATFFLLKDYPRVLGEGRIAGKFRTVWNQVVGLLGVYLRAEGTIALVQMVICGIGLRILQSPYFVLLAVLIGVVDALPVLGSGSVLIPWMVWRFLTGDGKMAVGLLVIYLLCTLNRQMLEPRLLGQKLGMSTLLTLFLMYIGYQLFGIFGFFLGPIGYMVGRAIYAQIMKKSCNYEKNIL